MRSAEDKNENITQSELNKMVEIVDITSDQSEPEVVEPLEVEVVEEVINVVNKLVMLDSMSRRGRFRLLNLSLKRRTKGGEGGGYWWSGRCRWCWT